MSKKLTKQDLDGFGRMAYRHWKKHRPVLFKYLMEQGKLFEHLKEAENQAEAYTQKAQRDGRDHHESLEIAKATWIILADVEENSLPDVATIG